jgi:beta-lactamase regulating signal transducer with metallopeptidase domain
MTDLLFSLAVAAVIRATALAAAVALILGLFRMRSSSTRHAAWATVLVVMLLMPVLTQVVPAIRVSVPERAIPLVPIAPVRHIDTPLPALPASMTLRQGGATAPVAAPVPEPGADAPMPPAAPFRWNAIVFAVYFAGLAFFLVRFVIGVGQLARIRRRDCTVTELQGEPVWESTFVAAPVTIGLLTPRVILPVTWREWSPDMLNAVLAHEREHCARRDPLVATVARLNTAIFWFHPLAWWLERKVATLAEHACDDAAVVHVDRRRYAETLLDIAGAVRRHHGRLVWHGVGVDGDGRLGQRIDRVLSGMPRPETSRPRRAMFAASFAVAIVVAVACQQAANVEPLREDPDLAARLKVDADRSARYRAAEQMTLEQAAALEKELEKNPEDVATREKLLTFYRWTGKNAQPWADNVAARRRHALWLVEHHPESTLVRQVAVTKDSDPEGYAQLRKRWLALTEPPNADARILSNAAWFFALPDGHPSRREGQQEIKVAEELLLRARKSASGSERSLLTGRLGRLYVTALAPSPGQPEDPILAAWAKQRLDASTDAEVLFSAGQGLFFRRPQFRELGRSYVERASRMDDAAAQRAREWIRLRDSQGADNEALAARTPRSEWRSVVEKSSGVIKLRQLASMADLEYGMAEYYDWRARQPTGSGSASPDAEQDKRLAAEGFTNAKEYAREAIDLAPSLTGDGMREAEFNARITYGLSLLREGNQKGAVEQMQETAELPASGEQPVGGWASGREYRLVFYLLKNGERQTVIDYFERASQGRSEARRKVMLAAAAAIRNGRMPEHYQRLVASGSL